ncbi:hypothetical protein KIN20_003243 [Parelaphostrongylus tenuis]|uniref:Uncharacterized protein n=1 Tax=Parelaphostrongylus tenuis TaxID=148309 RepID=A0AAD5MPN3_PARTN|nr:hypothetical protein KIN20_003243 [Parelaphostrongylus tenuis]
MLTIEEMSIDRPGHQSICDDADDYMFDSILDDGEDSPDGSTEEIDAVNDETFGDDFQASINSELEDYAAQTACLRLDDGATWDNPSCSKPPVPDASNVPLPSFDIFGTPTFSNFGTETMAKLDSLWSRDSHMHDIWGEQKFESHSMEESCPSKLPHLHDDVASNQLPSPCILSSIHGHFQAFTNTPENHYSAEQRSPILPPMPCGSTLHDLERHYSKLARPIAGGHVCKDIPSAAVNVIDLERRFIEEAAAVSTAAGNRRSTAAIQQTIPPLTRAMNNVRQRTPGVLPPVYGGVSPMQLPPILPPVHPMMLPLVPVWLEHLAGRTRYLPPGCPPVPPLFRLLFNTVKDPMIVMDMLRTAHGGSLPAPYPPPATRSFERRTQYHRKPGMPSGRTIEDLAFDQFAGYMSCKEREWLVKIQVLQCQGSGVPYDDDYYYTHWREKQIARNLKPKSVSSSSNKLTEKQNKNNEFHPRRVNGSRVHYDMAKEPKELIPLNVKFAGSLGLPSRSSANNPRHLISVEPSVENLDEDAAQRAGKQRKLRTLLLRLESALSLLIECEDIRVRLRNSEHNSEVPLSEISRRIDVIFVELMAEGLVKILQIGKGRSVVARSLNVGTPSDVIRIVLRLFSVMGSCPKKYLEDMSCDIIPSMYNGLMGLDREQLVELSSQLDFSIIKENLEGKNIFCRDSLLNILLTCVKRDAVSQSTVHWLCCSSEDVDFVDGWSSSISKWRELLPGIQDSDVQMLSDWLLLLSNDSHSNSLAKLLGKALVFVDNTLL